MLHEAVSFMRDNPPRGSERTIEGRSGLQDCLTILEARRVEILALIRSEIEGMSPGRRTVRVVNPRLTLRRLHTSPILLFADCDAGRPEGEIDVALEGDDKLFAIYTRRNQTGAFQVLCLR
jgi:hypothetical protein